MTSSASVESIFLAALGKTDPAERAAYLDEACRGDGDLRRQVERLLEAHPQVGCFLEQPPANPLAEGTGGQTRVDRPGGGEVADLLTPSRKPGSLGRLDHYEILQVVGRGGMGVVLKGFDEKLHRVVAIKMMAPELAVSATARQRFTREARAAAAVSHDHVVTIHGVEEDHQPPYLVMQFVDGISLQEKLDRHGPLGLKEVLRISLQAAEGLAAAHRQGLVHRDIKPANILLENGVERVKITDFGLARAVDDASLTQSGVIAGTPMYMSPEQAQGEPIDPRSDLFSLGSVLYAMCTGEPPFRAPGTHAVIRRVIDDTPRPIQEVNQEVPSWLCDIIARLHAKDPAARFQSAKEVADLLGQHLAHLQRPNQVAMPRAVEKPPPARPVRKRRWAGPVALCLLLVGVCVGLFLAQQAGWFSRPPQPSHPQHPDRKPASREVLEELRRLVAFEQEKFDRVKVNFVAERMSLLELRAAEAVLIEARIKLALAENKPVVALLENLVKARAEELSLVEARVEAGAAAETEALSAKARLSEARARLAEVRGESP